MTLVPVAGALDLVDNALVVATRNAGAEGLETLTTMGFQSFGGTVDDALDFGRRLADQQLELITTGGNDPMARSVLAVLQDDGLVQGSWVMRPGAGASDVVDARSLIGLGPGESGAPEVLSHHHAVRGVVAQGRWFPQ